MDTDEHRLQSEDCFFPICAHLCCYQSKSSRGAQNTLETQRAQRTQRENRRFVIPQISQRALRPLRFYSLVAALPRYVFAPLREHSAGKIEKFFFGLDEGIE